MSNHELGHVFARMVEHIVELHNDKKLSTAVAHDLIAKSVDLVCGYDGNEYEALERIEHKYCANCLRPYKENEKFITFDSANDCLEDGDKFKWGRWWDDELENIGITGRSLCQECFQKIFENSLSEQQRKLIMEKGTSDQTEERPFFY